jgi:hypothetical protein
MVLVAVVALAVAAEMTRRRGEAYAEKAAVHLMAEGNHRGGADLKDRLAAHCKQQAEQVEAEDAKGTANDRRDPERTPAALRQQAAYWAEQAAYEREHAAYYEKLKNKYEHAARYPWLPVEPDPPTPRRKR